MIQEIYIIDDNNILLKKLERIFRLYKKIQFTQVKLAELETQLKNIPAIIIVNDSTFAGKTELICETIRKDEDNSITPIIVMTLENDLQNRINILKKSVEYILDENTADEVIYYTILNIIRLLQRNRKLSPLTGLPGNVQIHAELKKRLAQKKQFAVLYLDLDNFKAYNDVYGFLKGDEIIKLAAKIITENVHENENAGAFVGHIGGDDFVAIVDSNVNYERVCQNIISDFDREVLAYFNNEDKERGYLEIANRKGELEQFILTSISIGVVVADNKKFHNILEIGEIGAQVKHIAKSVMGSSYAIDRRL